MKKCIVFGIAIFVASLTSHNSLAQTIEITPSYGYQFGSKLNYGSNYIKIEDSEQFGITIGMEADDDLMIEASYFHYGTELSIRDVFYSPSEQRLSDLSVDWILLGGAIYFPAGNLRPFLGGALGAVIFSPSEENTSIISRPLENSTKFALAFKGGVNIMVSDRIGINLQGNLMFPVTWGGVYVGGGPGGVSGGVGVSSTTIIGGFTGGLVFRIN
ncbi:MAG: hypothetical protein DRI70_06760 [Bacteroidetes bacterium]|nr:MAG: hypothetical protein DRI70_06760 [Bacteroidota bacterium]